MICGLKLGSTRSTIVLQAPQRPWERTAAGEKAGDELPARRLGSTCAAGMLGTSFRSCQEVGTSWASCWNCWEVGGELLELPRGWGRAAEAAGVASGAAGRLERAAGRLGRAVGAAGRLAASYKRLHACRSIPRIDSGELGSWARVDLLAHRRQPIPQSIPASVIGKFSWATLGIDSKCWVSDK